MEVLVVHKMNNTRAILLVALAMLSQAAQCALPCASAVSPDGSLELSFENGPDGMFWSLSRRGKTLVAPSRLGLTFALLKDRGRELGEMRIVEKKSRSSDTVWENRIPRTHSR